MGSEFVEVVTVLGRILAQAKRENGTPMDGYVKPIAKYELACGHILDPGPNMRWLVGAPKHRVGSKLKCNKCPAEGKSHG